MADLPIISPTKPIDMGTFAALYGGPAAPEIPVAARDYVASQWDNTGIGGRPETFFDKLRVQQQQAQISAMPRNQEGFITSPNRSAEGYALPAVQGPPTPANLATRAASTPTEIATLQPATDARSQFAVGARGGGRAVEEILLENTYNGKNAGGFNWESRTAGGNINYQGIKAIEGKEQLLNNKAFQALQTKSPEQAARIFQEFTGLNYNNELKTRNEQSLARRKIFTEGLQHGIIKGDFRHNPVTGILERNMAQPDPLGVGPRKEVWVPAEAEMQQAAKEFGKDALGYARNSMVDRVPAEHQGLFLSEYQKHKASGKGEREAAELAFQAVPSQNDVQNKVATLQKSAVTPSPGGPAPQAPPNVATLEHINNIIQNGARNPHDEDYVNSILQSTNPVELRKLGFPELANLSMTMRARQTASRVSQTMENVGDWFARNIGEPGSDVMDEIGVPTAGNNIVRGLYNLPNKISTMITGNPMYDWAQEPTPEELAMTTKMRDIVNRNRAANALPPTTPSFMHY